MSTRKALKSIAFTAAAQDHHVSTKIKSVLKWLKSGHEVQVSIAGKADRLKAMEAIYKQLESQTKVGAEIKQKLVKPESIKFNIRPTKDAENIFVGETSTNESATDELVDITAGKDIFSDEFEKELEQALKNEKDKNRRK